MGQCVWIIAGSRFLRIPPPFRSLFSGWVGLLYVWARLVLLVPKGNLYIRN